MINFINSLNIKTLILAFVSILVCTIFISFIFFLESYNALENNIQKVIMSSSSTTFTFSDNSYSSYSENTGDSESSLSSNYSTSYTSESSYNSKASSNSNSSKNIISKVSFFHTPIFMYHYVDDREIDQTKDPTGYNLTVKSEVFENDMKIIRSRKYKTLFAKDLPRYNSLPRDNYLVLTFDDGYEDFYTTAFPILQKYNLKSTIYIITSKVGQSGYLNWDELQELENSGLVEIGSHTLTHPNLQTSSLEDQKRQIYQSKKILEGKLGIKVNSFCYPSGKFSEDTVKLVEDAGYTNATTTIGGYFQKSKNMFEIERLRVAPEGVAKYL